MDKLQTDGAQRGASQRVSVASDLFVFVWTPSPPWAP